MNIDSLFDPQKIQVFLYTIREWFYKHFFLPQNLLKLAVQAGCIAAAFLLAFFLGYRLRRLAVQLKEKLDIQQEYIEKFILSFIRIIFHLCFAFLLWIAIIILGQTSFPVFLLKLALNLLIAWIIIKLATSFILDKFWSRIVATSAWTLAALNILGVLDPTLGLLEKIGFTIGNVRLNLLSLFKMTIIFAFLIKALRWVNEYTEKKLSGISELTPSTRVLLNKIINITLFVIVSLVALNSVGIDLTALAVFSGAVGVGVGFGLQKVVGNFISGLILLSDKSIKPGDVIQIDDVYGWVKEMGGRCVSVITRDEKEYLIPNEQLISQQVVNWSYSTKKIRIRVNVGISYNADPHKAMRLIEESVSGIGRILADPPPRCLLVGFGDSSVDLQFRFWIDDPQNGVANITSEVMLRIWDVLKENNIEIPFPQRDIHVNLKTPQITGPANGAPDTEAS